jgi:hypothetical protein
MLILHFIDASPKKTNSNPNGKRKVLRLWLRRRLRMTFAESSAPFQHVMHVGYYILYRQAFLAATKEEPFESCAHDIDENTVIVWASFPDSGHEVRFRERAAAEALPDVRSQASISDAHALKIAKYGVQQGHTTLDVSAALEKTAGSYMRLPNS